MSAEPRAPTAANLSGADGSWRHRVIRLLPESPDFEPIVLTEVDEDDVAVIAELVEVLR